MNPVVRAGTATAPDGAILAWRAEGSGPRALVACNGIGVSTFFWRRLSRHFAELGPFTFLIWDYRGHGCSPVPDNPESMTVAGCARDLWTVADAAAFGQAVLLGHSMGTQVILEGYRQRPERTLALVPMLGAAGKVLGSFPGGKALEPAFRMLVEVGAANAGLAGRTLRAVIRLPGVWEALGALGVIHPDLCPREEFEPYFAHLSQLDLRSYFALARDLLSHDAGDLLERIRVPALVVAGERDLFTPVQRSREMAARIPGAELLVLREGSHAALVEQPELVALTLEKFLARLATSAGT
ncbi:MAG: alpha/beta fold hydrolase [Myxococcales bacterium]